MNRLFLSRLLSQRQVWGLPVAAFAITSGIAYMVIGGAGWFFQLEGELAGLYLMLAAIALVLLAVPMVLLMASSARLMARRRDERFSSLRLLGASSRQLRGLALSEAAVLAAVGVGLGAVLYLALMPLVGLLPFAGSRIGTEGLWMGPLALGATAAGLLAVAVASAAAGMRRIEITPLGVRTRTLPARVHWIRLLIAAVGFVLAQVIAQVVGVGSMAVLVAMVLAIIAVPLVAVHLLGPWVLKLVAHLQLRRARTAERLIAARSVLESPQQMWQQIGGVAITTYVGVIAGAGMGLASLGMTGADAEELVLLGDIQRGVLLTLGVSFVMTACAVGISQTAQVLDRRDLYSSLAKVGLELSQLSAIRRLAVMRSLIAVVVIAVIAAALSALPLLGAAVLLAPASTATVAGVLMAGVLVVLLGVLASRPTLRRVIAV
ncbi:FtsX-like permease family protein [Nesterenkonia sp. HG001]|uniref:FtsX-like permease family protein n=1 Tax=Nesterenkonia sp. HG001 TaxID=2983207 RepID=UPI002AC49F18|nr:FtsX-like permease family protein [Nesterenkonia sp. HG001]MDZ5076299.1 permease [Nesterenkonia sp. HG001]